MATVPGVPATVIATAISPVMPTVVASSVPTAAKTETEGD
jgi:hypothetical protein